MLIAQLASMGMMVIDTVLLGNFNTADLAAVAVGGGIYIAIVLALIGVLQAITPIVAHLKGASEEHHIASALQQGFWLAFLLSAIGIVFLYHPDALLNIADIEKEVELKSRHYLIVLAWGLPASLLYRTFYAFCIAIGTPRPLMWISIAGTLLHGLLASALVNIGELGAGGCAISNASVAWGSLLCGFVYLKKNPIFTRYRLFEALYPPNLRDLKAMLKLGLPMGFSSFVEISAFTLIALLIAQLGTSVVAGHRIIANLAGICYMLPLSLAAATLAQVGHAAGARQWHEAKSAAWAGIVVSTLSSILLGGGLWLSQTWLINTYTHDNSVREVCLTLIGYLAAYQSFDAIQTVSAHALRGYKITFLPMFIHLVAFWGVGLYGGWLLAYKTAHPMGAAGFWLASALSLIFAAVALGGLLWKTSHTFSQTADND